MEGPHQLAGDDVPGPRVTGRPLGGGLLQAAAGDGQIAVDGGRRRVAVEPAGRTVHDLRRLGVDHAVVAERLGGRAGPGVQGDQVATHRAQDQPGRMRRVARPVAHAALRRLVAARQGIGPYLLAAGGIQRHDLAIRRADEHHTVHDQRRGRRGGQVRRIGPGGWRRVHVVGPGHLELAHVFRSDLRQRRKPSGGRVMPIRAPVARFRNDRLGGGH